MPGTSSTPRRQVRTRAATLSVLAIAALGGTFAAGAQADPCGGACNPPPPPPKVVSVYTTTNAYSTPYFNARYHHVLKPMRYIALCEAYSTSAGPYRNRWWTKLREGTWVNNGYLRGGVKMGIGDCPAPRNDAAAPPKPPKLTFKRCGARTWMSEAGAIGTGASAIVSMRPTNRARAFGHHFVKSIWRDLNRCVKLPKVSTSQRDSMYKQLACHALYGKFNARLFGGPTWDLEARQPNVSWRKALDVRNRCNWVDHRY